jgi:hypothetical protein
MKYIISLIYILSIQSLFSQIKTDKTVNYSYIFTGGLREKMASQMMLDSAILNSKFSNEKKPIMLLTHLSYFDLEMMKTWNSYDTSDVYFGNFAKFMNFAKKSNLPVFGSTYSTHNLDSRYLLERLSTDDLYGIFKNNFGINIETILSDTTLIKIQEKDKLQILKLIDDSGTFNSKDSLYIDAIINFGYGDKSHNYFLEKLVILEKNNNIRYQIFADYCDVHIIKKDSPITLVLGEYIYTQTPLGKIYFIKRNKIFKDKQKTYNQVLKFDNVLIKKSDLYENQKSDFIKLKPNIIVVEKMYYKTWERKDYK